MAVSFSETIILAVASAPTFQLILLLLILWVVQDLAAAASHPCVAVTALPAAAVTFLPIIPIKVLKTDLRPERIELAGYPARDL